MSSKADATIAVILSFPVGQSLTAKMMSNARVPVVIKRAITPMEGVNVRSILKKALLLQVWWSDLSTRS